MESVKSTLIELVELLYLELKSGFISKRLVDLSAFYPLLLFRILKFTFYVCDMQGHNIYFNLDLSSL